MDPLRDVLLWASGNALLRQHLPRYRFVRTTVARFMPGESAEAALDAGTALDAQGIGTTFTRLGENVDELSQAADTAGEYLRLLDRIEETGLDAEVSVKPTQFGIDLDADVTMTHVHRLVDRSAELDRTLWIDMESTGYVDRTIDLYETLRAGSPMVGICLQAYLRRTFDDLQRLLPLQPSIRLVKGAYREPAAVAFRDRRLIDESYLRLAGHLVRGGAQRVVLGTHDTDLVTRIERAVGGHDGFEVAMLFGIRSDEQRRLAGEGYRVRTLISYGPSWYPWFMRRIAEKPVANTTLALRNLF
jgi:proline dehydrogenase